MVRKKEKKKMMNMMNNDAMMMKSWGKKFLDVQLSLCGD